MGQSHRARNPCGHVGPCPRKLAAITRFIQRHRPPVPSRSKRGASGSQRFAPKRPGTPLPARHPPPCSSSCRGRRRSGRPLATIQGSNRRARSHDRAWAGGADRRVPRRHVHVDVLRPVLAPTRISVLTPRSSMRWWVSWVGVYCVLTSDVWKTERLPNLGNDLVSGMFAFGLAIFLCSIWVHSSRTRHSVLTPGGCEPG